MNLDKLEKLSCLNIKEEDKAMYVNSLDGVFDMMMVEKPTFSDIITALPLIFNGKLTKHRVIKSLRTEQVDISCKENIMVEADGIIVPNAHSCKVSILKDAIRMIVPKSEMSRA